MDEVGRRRELAAFFFGPSMILMVRQPSGAFAELNNCAGNATPQIRITSV
jgi:hypothetical protein